MVHLYKKRRTIEMSYSTLYARLTWADLSPTTPESPIVSSDLSSHITRTNKSIDGRPRSFHRRYRASSDNSDDDSQEIENFLEMVIRENKEDKVNINKGDTYMNKSNDDVKEEDKYGEICEETKCEVKGEDEHSEAASMNEVNESTSEVHHTEISSNKTILSAEDKL